MKREIAGHRRRKYSLQRLGEPALGIHHSGVLRLIDTRCGSPKGHLNGNRVTDACWRQQETVAGGGVVLRRAAFRGSGSDSTCAGRLRGASQRGPIPRRHSTHRPVQPRRRGRGMDTPGQAAERAKLDVALVAVLSEPAARPRTARPPTRSSGRAAGSKAAACSAATPAAKPPDQRYATCRQVLAVAAAWQLGWCGSQARLTVSLVSLVSKLSILPDVGGQEIETFDCNDLRLRSAVYHRLLQSTIACGG